MSFKNIDFALLFLLLLRNTGNQLPVPPAAASLFYARPTTLKRIGPVCISGLRPDAVHGMMAMSQGTNDLIPFISDLISGRVRGRMRLKEKGGRFLFCRLPC
jgi:hypothetical protein